jgi:hypothetical protein
MDNDTKSLYLVFYHLRLPKTITERSMIGRPCSLYSISHFKSGVVYLNTLRMHFVDTECTCFTVSH